MRALILTLALLGGACTNLPESREQLPNQEGAIRQVLRWYAYNGFPNAPGIHQDVYFVKATCGPNPEAPWGFDDSGHCVGGVTVLGKGSWLVLQKGATHYHQTSLAHELLHQVLGQMDHGSCGGPLASFIGCTDPVWGEGGKVDQARLALMVAGDLNVIEHQVAE